MGVTGARSSVSGNVQSLLQEIKEVCLFNLGLNSICILYDVVDVFWSLDKNSILFPSLLWSCHFSLLAGAGIRSIMIKTIVYH